MKFVEEKDKTSAVMLSPYAAKVAGYNATEDFFRVSKESVLGHEDNNASPDIWTIWTYGSDPGQPAFPESVVNPDGTKKPANTMIGVGYWLIKHLNTFPKVALQDTDAINANITKQDGSEVALSISKGLEGTIPFKISNALDPDIEISPVIRAVIDENSKDWEIGFELKDKDVTDVVIYNGGLNFIGNKRLSKENELDLKMKVKARIDNPSPMVIKIRTMSNISNTVNSEENYSITVKVP